MNWITLIGCVLVLVLCIKCANATPITTETTAASIVIKNSSHENHMDNLLYTTSDTTVSSTNNEVPRQPVTAKATHKPHTDRTQRRRRRPRHRKNSSNHSHAPDCRTTTERAPPTTKPTKVYVQFPGIFISHSWGPG